MVDEAISLQSLYTGYLVDNSVLVKCLVCYLLMKVSATQHLPDEITMDDIALYSGPVGTCKPTFVLA